MIILAISTVLIQVQVGQSSSTEDILDTCALYQQKKLKKKKKKKKKKKEEAIFQKWI